MLVWTNLTRTQFNKSTYSATEWAYSVTPFFSSFPVLACFVGNDGQWHLQFLYWEKSLLAKTIILKTFLCN